MIGLFKAMLGNPHLRKALLLTLTAGFAIGLLSGRALAPSAPTRESEKTEARTETEGTETSTERREERRAVVRRAKVERFDPTTGALVERRTELERDLSGVSSAVETAAHSAARTESRTERVVERQQADLRLRLDAGWTRLTPTPDAWGAGAEIRAAGPIWLGLGYERIRVPEREETRTIHVVRVSLAVEL